MSKAIVAADNPELQNATDYGLEWTVMKWPIEHEYGYDELPSIFQRALNVEHHVGEGHIYKPCTKP